MTFRLQCALLCLFALPAIADESGHPLTLWEVHGERNSVFLLGSIHLLRPGDYPLPNAIDSAYEEAESLIMEIDMDDVDPIAMQAAFVRYGVLQGDTTLRDRMGVDLYAEAELAANAIDIPLDMLDKTEPWYAAMTVEIMMLGRMGFNPALGVEMHMLSKAQVDGKPIDGFETIEEQLQFLDGMSLQAQRNMLLATLEESAELDTAMDEIVRAWRYGDTDALASNALDSLAQHEELNRVLVTDRNRRWVEQIENLLDDDDDYLIIVGALHLVGPDGVPRQLEEIGYDIRQLSEPTTVR